VFYAILLVSASSRVEADSPAEPVELVRLRSGVDGFLERGFAYLAGEMAVDVTRTVPVLPRLDVLMADITFHVSPSLVSYVAYR